MTEKKEKSEEEKVVNLCNNTKVPVHNWLPSEIDIVIVNPDGSTETIGNAVTCAATSKAGDDSKWQCWRSPIIIYKAPGFPAIKRSDCVLPSYWLRFAWHFVKLDNGRVVDFNSVDCTPTGTAETWTIQTKSIMNYRRRHPDPDDAEFVLRGA